MMSTFRDILSDFESAPRASVDVLPAGFENPYVLERPDVDDPIDGLSRWCKGCDEYWPLEVKFFQRSATQPGKFATRCVACSLEDRKQPVSRMRTPANQPGPLFIYFPDAPTKSCTQCLRVYPHLGIFWHQDASHALTEVCLSCKPIKIITHSDSEAAQSHAL
jgi:hypothetical protein